MLLIYHRRISPHDLDEEGVGFGIPCSCSLDDDDGIAEDDDDEGGSFAFC